MPEKNLSAEEEIKDLERRLEQKKLELGRTPEAPHEEKEIFREVLQKRIEEEASTDCIMSIISNDQLLRLILACLNNLIRTYLSPQMSNYMQYLRLKRPRVLERHL